MSAQVVYVWYDPKKNIPIYVGKGSPTRPFNHLKKSCKTRLAYTLRKRLAEGYDIAPKIISASSSEDSSEMEMLLIAMIGREDLGLGTLFNLTDGGEGILGHKHSTEAREKISAANRGTHKALGYKFTAEQRAKVSAAGIGRKHTAESKLKMSESTKGCVGSRLGMITSEETKAKQRAVKLGKICNAEHRANLKIANSRRASCRFCRKESTVPALGQHYKRCTKLEVFPK